MASTFMTLLNITFHFLMIWNSVRGQLVNDPPGTFKDFVNSADPVDQTEETPVNETVEYCSTSELQFETYTIDYSWTIKGICEAFGDFYIKNDHHPQPLLLTLSGLKFHESVLPGNWTISIKEYPYSNSISVSMAYDPQSQPQIQPIGLTGDLWVATPLNTVGIKMMNAPNPMDFMMPEDVKTFLPHADFTMENFEGPSSSSSLPELRWRDRREISQLMENYWKNKMAFDANTTTATLSPMSHIWSSSVEQPMEPMDEMSFVFHLTFTIPQKSFFQQQQNTPNKNHNCGLANAETRDWEERQMMKKWDERNRESEESSSMMTTDTTRDNVP